MMGVGCAYAFRCAGAIVLYYKESPGSILLTSFLSGYSVLRQEISLDA